MSGQPIQLEWRLMPWGRAEAVLVTCPECEQRYRLEHDIATDGTVSPSLQCPTPGCGFHEHVQLAGWCAP